MVDNLLTSYDGERNHLAAALCPWDKCPHLSYSRTSAAEGAKFLAENAFK